MPMKNFRYQVEEHVALYFHRESLLYEYVYGRVLYLLEVYQAHISFCLLLGYGVHQFSSAYAIYLWIYLKWKQRNIQQRVTWKDLIHPSYRIIYKLKQPLEIINRCLYAQYAKTLGWRLIGIYRYDIKSWEICTCSPYPWWRSKGREIRRISPRTKLKFTIEQVTSNSARTTCKI